MVDEEAEQCEAHDRAGQEATETEQIAATEWLRHAVIVHRSKLTQRTTLTGVRDWLVDEARCAVVTVGGRSVSRGCFGACAGFLAGARETYHERSATPKWIDQPRSSPWPARGPWAGGSGAANLGSRKVSTRVTTTIAPSALHIQGPV
jgi:hypothetical protein